MAQRYFEGALHAANYAKFRPKPPQQLGERILQFLKEKYDGPLNQWIDIGCGNGQSTSLLASHFKQVLGTDISKAQIEVAKTMEHPSNVTFKISPAEQLPAESNSVQLVSSSQACHWFNLPAFFNEVDRVLCSSGVIALFGYGLPYLHHPEKSKQLNKLLDVFYSERTHGYWGPGRESVDNEYKDIFIPYQEFIRDEVWNDVVGVSLSHFVGYLTTWSGFQNYCKAKGEAAGIELLDEFVSECQKILGTNASPDDIELKLNRKFFLLLGRKN